MLVCFTVLWGTWFPLISEYVQGHKVTIGGPFYNNVAIPVALLLLLLTAVGPLLAWRKTSVDSLKRNFLWPACGALVVGILMIALGVRPWNDVAYLYALMTAMLAALVMLTVASEFVRGARVIARHTGQGLLAGCISSGIGTSPLRRIYRALWRRHCSHRNSGNAVQSRY